MASALSNMLTVLCSFLSVTVIIACLVLKVPQIFRVLKEKKDQRAEYVQCSSGTLCVHNHAYIPLCYELPSLNLSGILFSGSTRFDFTVFGAPLKRKFDHKQLTILGIAFLCYVLAFRLVPDAVLTTCISLVTPVSVSSKLVQIVALLRSQDAGAVSAATWALATYGTLARSITTLVQTGDLMVLLNFAISFLLNSTMTTLIVIYQFKKPKDD